MPNHQYDVIVIGAGPAGYIAAIRCAQLGLKTACVDRWLDPQGKPALGGTCLNVGCIPSKALLESSELYEALTKHAAEHGIRAHPESDIDVEQMIRRKEKIVQDLTGGIAQLFRANQIDSFSGSGQLLPDRQVRVTPHEGSPQTLSAKQVILAPGSSPSQLESAPLLGNRIVDSSGALDWEVVPERLGIIGAGVIGLELGSVWRRLGSKVTLLEAQDRFLSMADQQVAKQAASAFRQQGLDIRLNARLLSSQVTDSGAIKLQYEDGGGNHSLTVDRLITAVGRQPNTQGLYSEDTELEIDERGFIHVNRYCETSVPGVYAIGDAVRGPMLAHKGSEEGVMVAERIAGQQTEIEYEHIPSVIYTHPEIAWVGKTEEQLKSEAIAYTRGVFPFAASGRARAMGETAGMVKILCDAKTDRIIGAHIIGPQASELIAQAVIAMEFHASSEDLARTVFAHPSLSEAVHEAALDVEGRALHIAKLKRR